MSLAQSPEQTQQQLDALAGQQGNELVGTVERTIFSNRENGYCVLAICPRGATSDLDERLTAVGFIPEVREGDEYRFQGEWKKHRKFGKQFHIAEHELLLPVSRQGIMRYLIDVGHGVGPATARRIVDALGDDALERIKEAPDCLRQLPFLKPAAADQIIEHLTNNEVQAELSALICREGITPRLAAKIYQQFGADSVRIVKDDPYILADQLWGVGFKSADKVAMAVGIAPDSPFRVRAAVDYLLREAGHEGHCYLRPRDVLLKVKELLAMPVETEVVAGAVDHLIEAGQAVREGNAIYAADLHDAECQLAGRVRDFLQEQLAAPADIDRLIDEAETAAGVQYAFEQRQAIEQALSQPLSIVCGGPGVGKTTVIRAICSIYEETHKPSSSLEAALTAPNIHLASPTGRAAQRMSEAAGRPARTIHRLLEYDPIRGEFGYDYQAPLPAGLVIVDETSMLDIALAKDLFAALKPGKHQVVLVGDVDQLPSVGPGSVLRDLINSGLVPTTRLKFNYRQAGGSRIAEYANELAAGQAPPSRSEGDYEYVAVEDDAEAAAEVIAAVKQAVVNGMDQMDFQVLSPMHRGKAGVGELNKAIREIANPHRPGVPQLGQYRIGDKVMCVKNNYSLGVFNGNLGRVVEIDKGALTAEIEGNEVTFAGEDLDLLRLAYCATIHKSQGSEFPLVIMPLLRHHYTMLQKNLLYTGMTRAKHRLVLISDGYGVRKAAANDEVQERFSLLAERIRYGGGAND